MINLRKGGANNNFFIYVFTSGWFSEHLPLWGVAGSVEPRPLVPGGQRKTHRNRSLKPFGKHKLTRSLHFSWNFRDCPKEKLFGARSIVVLVARLERKEREEPGQGARGSTSLSACNARCAQGLVGHVQALDELNSLFEVHAAGAHRAVRHAGTCVLER